jgi:hypothetical protein
MEISYNLTLDDLIAGTLFGVSRDSRFKTRNMITMLVFGILFGIFILIDIFSLITKLVLPDYYSGSLTSIIFRLIIGIVFETSVLMLPYFQKIGISRNAKKQYGHGPNGVTGDHRFIITPEKVTDITPIDESSFNWVGVGEVLSNDKFILIIKRASRSFWVIPKQAFANDSESNQFVVTANKYLQASRSTQPS